MTSESELKESLKKGTKNERMLFNYFKQRMNDLVSRKSIHSMTVQIRDLTQLYSQDSELIEDIEKRLALLHGFSMESFTLVVYDLIAFSPISVDIIKKISRCDLCLDLLKWEDSTTVTNNEIIKRVRNISLRLDYLFNKTYEEYKELRGIDWVDKKKSKEAFKGYKKIKYDEYLKVLRSSKSPNALCESCLKDLFKTEPLYLDMVKQRDVIRNKKLINKRPDIVSNIEFGSSGDFISTEMKMLAEFGNNVSKILTHIQVNKLLEDYNVVEITKKLITVVARDYDTIEDKLLHDRVTKIIDDLKK